MKTNAQASVYDHLDKANSRTSSKEKTSPTSSIRPQKSKPPPLRLDTDWSLLNPLAEFAEIATSPQSPLVRQTTCERTTYDVITSDSDQLHSKKMLPAVSAQKHGENESAGAMTYLSTAVDHTSPSSGEDSDFSLCENPSYSWPTLLWQRLKHRTPLQYDDITYREHTFSYSGSALVASGAGPSGILKREKEVLSNEMRNLKDVKRDKSTEQLKAQSKCMVTDTKWSPFYPERALSRRSLSCQELRLGDIRIPLAKSDEAAATSSTEAEISPTSEAATSVLFDLDSAAYALSSMAKRKEEHDRYQRKTKSSVQMVKRKGESRIKKKRNECSQAKRPMNAFMLFAKRYRLQITQKHPGKDNRAISVILGDQWKSLTSEERKAYIIEAKSLADEHKRIYPDCWKRKRTTQVSLATT